MHAFVPYNRGVVDICNCFLAFRGSHIRNKIGSMQLSMDKESE